jgi:hypothetical protein
MQLAAFVDVVLTAFCAFLQDRMKCLSCSTSVVCMRGLCSDSGRFRQFLRLNVGLLFWDVLLTALFSSGSIISIMVTVHLKISKLRTGELVCWPNKLIFCTRLP